MSCYREIMSNKNLPSQFKQYVSVCDLMKSKSVHQGMSMEQIVPDLLLFSERKAEYIINSFCQYLTEEGFDFIGENQILKIKLPKINAENNTNIYNRINDMFILSNSFRGAFKGIVCIYIDNTNNFNYAFTDAMQYIKSKSEGCLRVIVVNDMKEYKRRELEKALSMASYRIYTVKSDSLSAEKACIFLGVKLEKYGFNLDSSAKNALGIMVNQLIDSHKLKSLYDVDEYLSNDILFFLLGNSVNTTVTEDMINHYFQQCILYGKKEETHHIGFIGTREE
ncbi:MAG: hypothetical protein LIO53_08350 [Oscillospiraceae bacterium]|nr:hypothetical protein [Oscillospiraceae bacterium]